MFVFKYIEGNRLYQVTSSLIFRLSKVEFSANYLSDLLSKYTGKSTQEHIHLKLIDNARSMLWSTESPISAIAFDLGFGHPSHLTKLFKNKTGHSSKAYRELN